MSDDPVVMSSGENAAAPLVVLLHGRGSNEQDLFGLVEHLAEGPEYTAVRGPLDFGPGYTWFTSEKTAQPNSPQFEETLAWFRSWLDRVAPAGRKVVLIGFSAGAVFSGGLALGDPKRFAGLALLSGPLPLGSHLPLAPGGLAGLPVFSEQGEYDQVIGRDLFDRTLAYLTEESGAVVTSRRDPIAHEVSMEELQALRTWLEELTR